MNLDQRGALRFGLPRLSQVSTKAGLAGVLIGAVAVLFGADIGLADVLSQTVTQVLGGVLSGAGIFAVFADEGTD